MLSDVVEVLFVDVVGEDVVGEDGTGEDVVGVEGVVGLGVGATIHYAIRAMGGVTLRQKKEKNQKAK